MKSPRDALGWNRLMRLRCAACKYATGQHAVFACRALCYVALVDSDGVSPLHCLRHSQIGKETDESIESLKSISQNCSSWDDNLLKFLGRLDPNYSQEVAKLHLHSW